MDNDDQALPREWDALDHAIYDCKIRQKMSWRQVGREVNMSFSAARKRFYRRMAAVEVPEIQAMRQEENEKLDDREERARLVWRYAMAGTPVQVDGRPLHHERNDGTLIAVIDHDLRAALAALNAEATVAAQRARLNGLEAPIKLEISDYDPTDEIEAALMAYNQGRADAQAEAEHVDDRAAG